MQLDYADSRASFLITTTTLLASSIVFATCGIIIIVMSNPVVVARIGRDRQRYEDNFRLVSGCIPYKRTTAAATEDDDADQNQSSRSDEKKKTSLQVLMLSSPKRDDLVFPKGGWEDDETVEEAARREALEEAGVRGFIKETLLGTWEFRSKSSQEVICSGLQEGCCRGYMFAMEVTQELDIWPEKQNRSRIWLSIKEASEQCRYDWMREALESFSELMAGEDSKHEEDTGEEPQRTTVEEVQSDDVDVVALTTDCQTMSKTSNSCIKSTLDGAHQHCSSIAPPPPIADVDLMCMCSY